MGEERQSAPSATSEWETIRGVATHFGSSATTLVDVEQIAIGRWGNRLPASYEGQEFAELKRAIAQAGGNTQAVMVVALFQNGVEADHRVPYELIAGHRRVQACRELGLPVRAVVLPKLSEPQLFALVYQENSLREALRPYELGRMCAAALSKGLFSSLRQLCAYLQVDLASASRAVRLYEMPMPLHQLIRTPLQWQLKDVDRLNKHIAKHDFDARVEELRQVHGSMDRVPLLRALAGVGSTNDELAFEIIDGSGPAGCLYLNAKGKVRLVLHRPLARDQAASLRSAIEAQLVVWSR